MVLSPPKRLTYSVKEAASLIGISDRAAWDVIARTGQLVGVTVLRPSPRRVVIPKAALDAVLRGEPAEDREAASAST